MMHKVILKLPTSCEKDIHRIFFSRETWRQIQHRTKSGRERDGIGNESQNLSKFHRARREATLYLERSTLKGRKARKLRPLGKPWIGKCAKGRIVQELKVTNR